MFHIIENLPENVLGIEVHGKVTHKDYMEGIIPAFEEKLEHHKPLKAIYVIAEDFTGMDIAAAWDDMTYGLKHWQDISHIALISDISWIRASIAVFTPFFPGQIRFFKTDELEQAKEWITAPGIAI